MLLSELRSSGSPWPLWVRVTLQGFCSPAFLFLIPSPLMQGSIGGFAVFVRKEAAFFSSGFPAM